MEEILEHPWLVYEFLGNTVWEYILAFGVFILFLILFKLFQVIILLNLQKFAERTSTDIDDTLIEVVKSLRPPFYSFLAVYFAIRMLELTEFAVSVLNAILILWITYQTVIAAQILINYMVRKAVREEDDKGAKMAIDMLGLLVKIVLWSLGFLMVLSNLGVNVTSLIAGLGIGGIAIALALQNILGDLFSSFAIYFDKPFKVGDFIIVGDKMGTVQKIGIKTTRIKALQGEEIVMSNKELTTATIQNYKKMEQRRIVFTFGVVYQTSPKQLRKISSMVKDIVEGIEDITFDRAHFYRFDDSALTYEVVYYVKTGDYNLYMDIQEEINIAIHEQLAKEGISMAFPTRTLYMHKAE